MTGARSAAVLGRADRILQEIRRAQDEVEAAAAVAWLDQDFERRRRWSHTDVYVRPMMEVFEDGSECGFRCPCVMTRPDPWAHREMHVDISWRELRPIEDLPINLRRDIPEVVDRFHGARLGAYRQRVTLGMPPAEHAPEAWLASRFWERAAPSNHSQRAHVDFNGSMPTLVELDELRLFLTEGRVATAPAPAPALPSQLLREVGSRERALEARRGRGTGPDSVPASRTRRAP